VHYSSTRACNRARDGWVRILPNYQTSPRRTSQGRGSRRTSLAVLALLAMFGILTSMLTACDLGISGGASTSATPLTTPAAQIAHRDHLTLVACNDTSSKYTRDLFRKANAYLTTSLEAAVTPNQDGLTAYFLLINSQTTSVNSQLPPLVIPPTPPEPTPPAMQPLPTPDPQDPYGSGQKKQVVIDANNKALQQYQRDLAALQAQLAQLHARVHETLSPLQTIDPPIDTRGASVWGCALKASEYFSQVPAPGTTAQGAHPETRWLVISSAMDETEWIDRSSQLRLAGVHILIIDYYCMDSAFCAYKRSTWTQVFQRAGAADWQFLDPAQSAALPPLFQSPAASAAGGAR